MKARPLHWPALRAEMALTRDGDLYGWAMEWWFAIAGRLHDDGEHVPDHWHYRPSPFGGADPDGYADGVLRELEFDADTLRYGGDLLCRFVDYCKRKGLDY